MSLLSAASRSSPQSSSCLFITNKYLSREFSSSSRCYASKGGAVKTKQAASQKAGAGKKGLSQRSLIKIGWRRPTSGIFKDMPAASLKHPLLQSDRRGLGLPMFSPRALTSESIGTALQFPVTNAEPYRAFGLPKNLWLEHRLLSSPYTVVRDVTISTLNFLDEAGTQSSLAGRRVLVGSPGSGKSTLLLQAVEYCKLQGWAVIYVPRAINLVNSTTSYAYDARTQLYLQPYFSFQTLQRLLLVNAEVFAKLTTQKDVPLERRPTVPAGSPLTDLVNVGIKDRLVAPTVLSSLLEELGTQQEVPVLIAVDGYQALYTKSAYRDPQYNHIKSFHLSVPRLLLEYASGKKILSRGTFLGAVSSDTLYPLPLELGEALSVPIYRPAGPYEHRTPEFIEYTKGLQALHVPEKLSIPEAASLFDVLKEDHATVARPWDETFLALYSASSGNARDFVWKGILSTLET